MLDAPGRQSYVQGGPFLQNSVHMAKLPILIAPDRRLKTRCSPVASVDERVRQLMDDMLQTMYDAPGIGLAAPQVGVTERVIVVDVAREGDPPSPIQMANPEIVWSSDETVVMNEGCLSLPDIYVDVERPEKVAVRWVDRDNAVRELEADELLARCLQHEIDHLNGVIHIDYLSSIKRNMILRKLEKQRKLAAAG